MVGPSAGLAHGNRGRISKRRIPEAMRERILELARTTYLDYNDQPTVGPSAGSAGEGPP